MKSFLLAIMTDSRADKKIAHFLILLKHHDWLFMINKSSPMNCFSLLFSSLDPQAYEVTIKISPS